MGETADGRTIANQRIAAEAEARTGFLDLGGLGLTALPPGLFGLRHLRELNLGAGIQQQDGRYHEVYKPWDRTAARNDLGTGLDALRRLPELRNLSVSGTPLNDLRPLSGLVALQSLDCMYTQVSDLAPLSGLVALQSLNCRCTPVSDLAPLSGPVALQSLNCVGTRVSDLAPLSGLVALQSLNCRGTPVSDLAPLSGLLALQSLNCRSTRVSDLAPLSGLLALQSLGCGGTLVSDLAPLSGLLALQSLDCGGTLVSDLAPLSGLVALQSLDCRFTPVSDLAPLSGLVALQSLDCGITPVSDLAPLSGLVALQSLDCRSTRVSDLAPLSGLVALQSLDCGRTPVSDLAPLSGLVALQSLDCSDCTLDRLPDDVRQRPSLQKLVLYQSRVPGIPAEVLSQQWEENCLDSLRAHFRDLADGAAAATDVKLIVLGNGRVGKTQICHRLRHEPFDPDEPSTHGILVTSAELDTGAREPTRLNIWDFGGQDLYHGTHALFLRTSAIFLLVWARETEDARTHEYQGIVFRNQPLPYWLAYVRHLGSADSPVLIAQTRCDRPQDEALAPPLDPGAERDLAHCVSLHYSALNDRGRDRLDRALREAVDWLRERQGAVTIGIGRLRVQRALQALRDADAAVPPGQRQYRTIARDHFLRLCTETGAVSSPDALLSYLHNAGIVFHRPELFQGRIVLDQGWALEAIYAVFNRQRCFRELKRLHGRFTRPLLEVLVWDGHSPDEQRLFLDMMQSCGICFAHRPGPYDDRDATEYIAPDLLPDRSEVAADLAAVWDPGVTTLAAAFDFEMLHPGLVRGLICEIGAQAGTAAVYWLGGVAVYDTATRSHALIEQDMADGWHGTIRVQTQGGQAALLLDRLTAWIEQRSGRDGLRAHRHGAAPASRRPETEEPVPADTPPLKAGPAPVEATEYFVSYAWGDDASPEGREREAVVDRLCAAAEARGIRILRDKRELRTGDRITPFMRRIGAGDRVFVVLSGKYLRSAWCMYELLAIWTHSRHDEADFRRRVRIYALPDGRPATVLDRARLAAFWKQEHDGIAALIREHGAEILATEDFVRFKHMGDFYRHVPDILATLFDTVQPRSFEELERYGFTGDPDG
jgi:internalin A